MPRWEDPRLLRGGGRYSDDLNRPDQAYGYVLRSPTLTRKYCRSIPRQRECRRSARCLDRRRLCCVWAWQYSLRRAAAKPDGSPMFLPPNAACVPAPLKWSATRVLGGRRNRKAGTGRCGTDNRRLRRAKSHHQHAHALDTDAGTVWDEAQITFVSSSSLATRTRPKRPSQTRTTLPARHQYQPRFCRADGTRACIGEYDDSTNDTP